MIGVSSAVMSLAIEFIYTGQFTSTYEHFFDLLLVANMYELKELEAEIMQRLLNIIHYRGAFADHIEDHGTYVTVKEKMLLGEDRRRLIGV